MAIFGGFGAAAAANAVVLQFFQYMVLVQGKTKALYFMNIYKILARKGLNVAQKGEFWPKMAIFGGFGAATAANTAVLQFLQYMVLVQGKTKVLYLMNIYKILTRKGLKVAQKGEFWPKTADFGGYGAADDAAAALSEI